ncbi:MAG: MarR family transcriptional regulator [Spirochaetaceae bacterium]|nr:MarR family transcriptional regulator [Spirochaetaceae bacterium]
MNTEPVTFENEINFRNLNVRYKKLFKKIVFKTISDSDEWCLSESQAMTLLFITNHSPCNMGEIHNHSPLTKGALTQIIAIFEEKNLIERIHSTDDRRLVLVNTTDTGLTLGHKIGKRLIEQLHKQLDKLDEDEKITLNDSLININYLLEKMENLDD